CRWVMLPSGTPPPSSTADPQPPLEEPGLVWRPGPPDPGQPRPAWPPLLVAEDLLAAGIGAAVSGRGGGGAGAARSSRARRRGPARGGDRGRVQRPGRGRLRGPP